MMQVAIGLIDGEDGPEFLKLMGVEFNILDKGKLGFQVGLAVKVGSFDIAELVLLSGVQEDEIGGYRFIILYLDNVSRLDLLPLYLRKLTRAKHCRLALVDFFVFLVSPLHIKINVRSLHILRALNSSK